MSLVTMKSILDKARENHYAVLATNMLNLEMVLGGIEAAEELRSPLILQLAPVQFNTTPLKTFAPLMIAAAKQASVPVAVHLDHGTDLEDIKTAIELGFTSVMFDGSLLSLEENEEVTRTVVELAHVKGVTVEAEIGYIGSEGEEGNVEVDEASMTQPKHVVDFVSHTNCDCLAVSIGNVHGLYKKQPNLQFELLKSINDVSAVPLVLHGGSGTNTEDLQRCVANGICKVNLASEIHHDYMSSVVEFGGHGFPELSKNLRETTKRTISRYMTIIGSKGQA